MVEDPIAALGTHLSVPVDRLAVLQRFTDAQTIDAAVEAFRSGDQLPPELLEALAALAAPGARSTPATRAGERG